MLLTSFSSLQNVDQIRGKIVVSVKGGCYATRKRRTCQEAGAAGIIIFSSEDYIGFVSSDEDGEDSSDLSIQGVEIANQYQDFIISQISQSA